MKPLVTLTKRSRVRRRTPAWMRLPEDVFNFSDANSALYFSQHFNARQIKILLRFEADTNFDLPIDRTAVAGA